MSSKSSSNNSIQTFKQRNLKAEFIKKYFEEKYKKSFCTFSYKNDGNKPTVKLFDNMYLVRKVNKSNNITEAYEVYIQDDKIKHKFSEYHNNPETNNHVVNIIKDIYNEKAVDSYEIFNKINNNSIENIKFNNSY